VAIKRDATAGEYPALAAIDHANEVLRSLSEVFFVA
jgi:hypothetical protein